MRFALDVDHLVSGQRALARLEPLLQPGFWILETLFRIKPVQAGRKQAINEGFGRIVSAIQKDGGGRRLESIGQNRRAPCTTAFHLAVAETQGLA